MTYRTAEATDADLIAQLHADSWRRTYRGMYPDHFLDGNVLEDRLEVWRRRLGQPSSNQFVGVAVADSGIAGFICAYGGHDREWGSFIDNLHVAPEFQRRGIASELMRLAARWLSSSYGALPVHLRVMEANHAARRFYESLDGTNTGIVKVEFPGGVTSRTCRYAWANPDALVRRVTRYRPSPP